ncbi:DUF523 domain-containing protein [Hydrogenimonas cancrithermarum]|uniref:DUF523 domain-containing protein n=1 Tax=Hydrogenimonas cancrithermarum TaxID=2993563 RepID=A0ABM8FKA9_9BACT|nr:DUF523 domain-containing protein [Hydrogenimonas cancrithermarum]BDY12745.1 hypothetical protein HCR_10570 [Hydrogenimonas cancrithermarum]
MGKKVAVSACLAGKNCRYNGEPKGNPEVMEKLEKEGCEIVFFCPEDACFGTPREAMDLTVTPEGVKALTKYSKADRTEPIVEYAEKFFEDHPDIDLFVGKARSPSCGVRTGKLYDEEGNLISEKEAGIMAAEAKARGIEAVDDENY